MKTCLSLCALSTVLIGSMCESAAAANETGRGGFRFDPIPVAFRDVPEFHAAIGRDSGFEGGVAECAQQIRTWSAANFSGGSFIVQAGFAEGEIAAVSFAVPAGEFPVRIDLAEAIFATSNTTVTTTTKWSIMFWEGTPATGQLVQVFSSDGTILPHLILPPGTNGANIQFSVDPGDPEQLILQNNGSGIISVGYRIDEHNNGPANPCNSIPTNSNAFPTVDTGGLHAPTTNWISVINCGGLACPAGWFSFNQLISFCKPSGDWNIRLTYTGLGCAPPAPGACCLPSGACAVNFPADCTALGGTFQGPDTTCVGVECVPTGNVPCCFQATGGCVTLSYANCTLAGGIPGPVGQTCAGYVCFPMGACCKPDGTCANMSPTDCAALGGLYQGNGTTCAQVTCPEPVGAACFPNNFCLQLTAEQAQNAGAVWQGAGTTCQDLNGNGIADICDGLLGDINGDGLVNGADLGILLANWETASVPSDLNGDGIVNGADLGILLSQWTG